MSEKSARRLMGLGLSESLLELMIADARARCWAAANRRMESLADRE